MIYDVWKVNGEVGWVAFVENFSDDKGISKRTYASRFSEFEKAIVGTYKGLSSNPGMVKVVDVAVSSGVTSVDFFNLIEKEVGTELRFIATDKDYDFLCISDKASRFGRVILSEDMKFVQVVCPPFVYQPSNPQSRIVFPLNHFLAPFVMRYGNDLVSKWKRAEESVEERRVVFVAPAVQEFIRNEARFSMERWDIIEPCKHTGIDIIRAMNILNNDYFSIGEQKTILSNLVSPLKEGGLLALGSNDSPGSNVDGVLCRKLGHELEEVVRFGSGFRCHAALQEFL